MSNNTPYVVPPHPENNILNLDDTPVDIAQFAAVPGDETIGIKTIYASKARFISELPVTDKLTQPMGILHGGYNVVLAESVASFGSWLHAQPGYGFVGLEININHIKPAMVGDTIIATGQPVHVGKDIQVWSIIIRSKKYNHITAIARCTTKGVRWHDMTEKYGNDNAKERLKNVPQVLPQTNAKL